MEGDAIYAGEYLNFPRFPPDLDDGIRLQKIALLEADVPEAEFFENLQKFRGILIVHCHKKIQIPRVSGKSVKAYGIATHHEVINFSCLE